MTIDAIIQKEAKSFVAMARVYASQKAYQPGWVRNAYLAKYPADPLSEIDFQASGALVPNKKFKQWVRQYHPVGVPGTNRNLAKDFLLAAYRKMLSK